MTFLWAPDPPELAELRGGLSPAGSRMAVATLLGVEDPEAIGDWVLIAVDRREPAEAIWILGSRGPWQRMRALVRTAGRTIRAYRRG